MSPTSTKRAPLWRVLLVALPAPLVAASAVFAGCSRGAQDLDSDAGTGADADAAPAPDAGTTAPAPDAAPIDDDDDAAIDAAPIDAADASTVDCTSEMDAAVGPPNDLVCTGLYSDIAAKTIDPRVQAFDPGLHLWSDGAEKHRWILLPVGAKIDSTDMNEWRFPVGTKVWKEFKLAGHRIETRLFWKRGDGDWVRGTYRWSDDESGATYLATGETNVGGTSYEIPTLTQCDTCHAGRIDRLLGFEAVGLSQPQSSGLNVSALVAQGLLTKNPTSPLAIPDDGTGKGQKALAWLHANCGTACHNDGPSAFAASTGLWMRLEVQSDGTLGAFVATSTYKTAVNQPPLLDPYASQGWKRIKPNDPFTGDGLSLLPFRDGKRNDAQLQMPPIDSNLPDLDDVAMVRDWIQNGTFPPGSYPP